jgi:hypothetical protein
VILTNIVRASVFSGCSSIVSMSGRNRGFTKDWNADSRQVDFHQGQEPHRDAGREIVIEKFGPGMGSWIRLVSMSHSTHHGQGSVQILDFH